MKRSHELALIDFVASLEAAGFGDPDADINGGDIVQLVGDFFDSLQEAAKEIDDQYRRDVPATA